MGKQNLNGILKTDLKVILALCLVHFCGDFYQSFIKPLLPALVERYSLTLAEVGLITGVNTFLAFLVQPSVGYLADHYRTRFFVVGGALLSALFVPLMGLAPGFGFLLVCVGLGSVGSAMFHPTAAGMVSTYAGAHSGLSMSLFGLGGTLAFTVGPLLATVYVTAFGLTFLPLTSIFGVAAFFVLLALVPQPESEGLGKHGFWGSLKQSLGGVWKAIGLIWLLTVIRSFVDQSLSTFIPILYAAEGHSLISTGLMISLFSVGGAVGGLVGGHLADRIGFKPVFYFTYGLSVPCTLAWILAPSLWAVYLGAFASGVLLLATMFPAVALAQHIAPKSKALVSSLVMGLSFGAGGLIIPLSGAVADFLGLRLVLCLVAAAPLLSLGLIRFLPEAGEAGDKF